MTEAADRAQAEQMERLLAGKLSWGIPAATALGAIVVGVVFGVGPGILVLAAGALVGVIGLLWASLRTLGGDAPLAEGLATAAAARVGVGGIAERKRRVLRALKDLELEHSVGKLDDEDFAQMSATYRAQAKAILREIDVEIEPLRAKAEAMARAHLAKKGLAETGRPKATETPDAGRSEPASAPPTATDGPESGASARLPCLKCATSNEPDAAFCKKCGANLARIACPTCKSSNEPDATFCKGCGGSLERADALPPSSEAKRA